MGVYVFRSAHAPWVKVGHHLARPRRPHAYYRVAGRGFESVVHPRELDGRLGVHDLVLEAWYPTLTRADEGRVHRACARADAVGEFHPLAELDAIRAACEALGGVHAPVSDAQRARAIAWGARRARAAARRAA
jgi:hypothetical protein